MTIYDLVTGMTDYRLPEFEGAGVKREGAQVSFGKGRGMLFLSQILYVTKMNGKIVVRNMPY